MSIRKIETIEERRKFVEKTAGVSLKAITVYPKELEEASQINCENMIGATSLPLGIAGPLKIQTKNYYIPLCTTEGALVASVNRGCKAISLSGGANVLVENIGATRGPVFSTSGIKESWRLKKWLVTHFDIIDHCSRETSSHLRLLKLDVQVVGKQVFVRFYFDTQDAMGMNMATIASARIVKLIEEQTGIKCLAVAGNYDIDKKPSFLNFISGRGKKVWAEVVLKKKVIEEVLKTTPDNLHKAVEAKCHLGSIMAGSLGFNAHFANIIAAIFLATGQDAAHVVEGSLGVTTTEIVDNGLYISVYLPDLMVGTIGGGTYLPAQKEALEILGIAGGKKGINATRFAEIIGTSVLAGEISLLSSISEGSLASAHQKLARK